MRLLLINTVLGYGSTGRIALDIAKEYEKNGYEVKIAYGRKMKVSKEIESATEKYGIRIGNDMDVYYHVLYTRLTDKHGLASKRATKNFLKWAEEYNPDIVWLHNIHGYYINYEMLFDWIKSRPQMQVKWTLHDCWTFTGHCSHFMFVGCNKWQNDCCNCVQIDQYPKANKDNSRDNYLRKKKAFSDVNNMTIIVPSKWLKEKVQQSFLNKYQIEVKYNIIDKSLFKPTQNTFKQDHNMNDKVMILGVASVWNDRKGLNDFIELDELLARKGKKNYKIVLIGLKPNQIEEISKRTKNILALPRTSNMDELVQIYSAADVFINPSYEETFGLTTVEAQACGTPTIVYKGTACEEISSGENNQIVEYGAENLYKAIGSCLYYGKV